MIDVATLSNIELTERLLRLAEEEREKTAEVVETLAEFEKRRLHEPKGFSSLFDFCTRVLGLSEDAAAKRIHVARAAKAYPSIISRLRSGRLPLSTAALLVPHLTPGNHRSLLDRAEKRSRREVEALIAGFAPRREAREVIRHLGRREVLRSEADGSRENPGSTGTKVGSGTDVPTLPGLVSGDSRSGPGAGPPGSQSSPSQGPASIPREGEGGSADGRVRFAFNGSEVFLRKVERCRQLLRHKYPRGDLEDILGEAVETLLERCDPDRKARRASRRKGSEARARRGTVGPSKAPEDRGGVTQDPGGRDRPGGASGSPVHPETGAAVGGRSRRVPRGVKDQVWRRDEGRCVFVAGNGARCGSRDFLEYDHLVPWAVGGTSGDPANIRLLCRAHNQHLARERFGDWRARPP